VQQQQQQHALGAHLNLEEPDAKISGMAALASG
jgi:hypothetical protein